ncbi:MAG: S8 family serine peptidase [bacterium]
MMITLLITGALSTSAFEMRMASDRLTIHAENIPLRDLLAQFQETGVLVAMDDRINPLVTANFENREIGDGVKRLLADCDYALTWQTIDGPAGKMRRIAEILVYKPGNRRPLTPLPATSPQTRTIHTNNVNCLRNEILLRLRPGTTKEQFLALLLETRTTVLDGIPALGLYRLHFPPDADLADLLNTLAKNPLVDRAEPNLVYRSFSPVKSQGQETPGILRTLTTAGVGPSVAILDSGFSPSEALEKAVVATLDATTPGQPISDPVGHGTQMAFIASGAVTPDGVDSTQDSRAVSIIPIRTMDDKGITSGFSLMQSMIFALDHGARVINMSWGSDADSGFFNEAMGYTLQRGAVLVAAAGNEPTGLPLYPAALPGIIAVAALAPDGTLWNQSNYGPFVKLAAPGFANLPTGYKGPPGTYGGTSIAAAYTARVIAQYFTTHPAASATEAIGALNQALTHSPTGITHPEIPHLDNKAVSAFLTK